MTEELLATALVPLAAELVGTVRDFGPDDVRAVLSRVPDGRFDALAVVLAAMVNPDEKPSRLLAWTTSGPVRSRDKAPEHLQWRQLRLTSADALGRNPERRAEIARLTAVGLSARQIGDRLGISSRAVTRHRSELRRMTVEKVAS